MSIKTKVLAAAATLTAANGLAAAGTAPATAATPQCGPHCIQIFSAKFGTNGSPKVQHLRNPEHVRISQLWGANILN